MQMKKEFPSRALVSTLTCERFLVGENMHVRAHRSKERGFNELFSPEIGSFDNSKKGNSLRTTTQRRRLLLQ